MNKIILSIIVLLVSITIAPLSSAQSYEIDWENDNVFWDNQYMRVSVSPISSDGLTRHVQYPNIQSKLPDQDLDFAFMFDYAIKGKIYKWGYWGHPNEEPIYGMVDISYTCNFEFNYTTDPNYFWCYQVTPNETTIIEYDHSFLTGDIEEKTATWQVWGITGYTDKYYWSYKDFTDQMTHEVRNGKHFYWIKNVFFEELVTQQFKLEFITPVNSDGKWELWAKRSSESLEDALANGHYINLDPWWHGDWANGMNITVTESDGVARINEPIFVNATGLTIANATKEIRVVDTYCNNGGNEIPSQVIASDNEDFAFFVYLGNASASGNTMFCLYYNNPGASAPVYTSDLVMAVSAANDETNVTTGYYDLMISDEWDDGNPPGRFEQSGAWKYEDSTGGNDMWIQQTYPQIFYTFLDDTPVTFAHQDMTVTYEVIGDLYWRVKFQGSSGNNHVVMEFFALNDFFTVHYANGAVDDDIKALELQGLSATNADIFGYIIDSGEYVTKRWDTDSLGELAVTNYQVATVIETGTSPDSGFIVTWNGSVGGDITDHSIYLATGGSGYARLDNTKNNDGNLTAHFKRYQIDNASVASNMTDFFATSIAGKLEYTIAFGAEESSGDSTAPEITLSIPADNGEFVSPVDFRCSAVDEVNITNITFYGNWTAWHANETVTGSLTDRFVESFNPAPDFYDPELGYDRDFTTGTYKNVQATTRNITLDWDSQPGAVNATWAFVYNIESASNSIKIYLYNYSSSLWDPRFYDGGNTTQQETDVFFTIADYGISNKINITIEIGVGSLNAYFYDSNMTYYFDDINGTALNFTRELIDGIYKFNCLGCDSSGNCNTSLSNYTFTVDSTAPTITFPVYGNATQHKSGDSLIVNISVSDGSGVGLGSICNVSVTGQTTNTSIPVSSGWCNGTVPLASGTEGNSTIFVYMNDTLGNLGLNNSYVVWIDDTDPAVTLSGYTNATKYQSSGTLILNLTVTDTGGVGVGGCNVSIAAGINTTLIPDGVWCNFSISLSGVAEGNNTINVYVNDTVGNWLVNQEYAVYVDDTPPFVNITSPINTTYNYSNIWVNYTFNEGLDWVAYQLNGEGNVTITGNTSVSMPNGLNNITLLFNDTFGNYNQSTYIYFTANVQALLYDNITIDPVSPQTYEANPIQFNITWYNETVHSVWIEHNFTGTSDLYFMSNISSEYFYDYTENLGIGGYVYQFYANTTLGSQNQTEQFVYVVNQADSALTMEASPSWSVAEYQSVTITCTAAGNVTLTKDDIPVANPHTTSLTLGTYEFNCTMDDDYNYTPVTTSATLTVTQSGYGCTDTVTFAFNKNFTNLTANYTTINFEDFVDDSLVKSDLSDVYTADATIYTNLTGGYYIILNTTGITNVTLYWGNYVANYSYDDYNLSANVSNLSGYVEINPYYVFTIYEEMTGAQQLPPDTNSTVLSLYCSNGSSSITLYDTAIMVATFDVATEAYFNIYYPTTQYTRTYILGSNVEYKNIYLTDATQYTVLQIPLEMLDFNYWNSEIYIYKFGGAGEIYLTEGLFDIEHVFDTYLVKDQKYFIRIIRDSETRDLGFLYAIEAGTQSLSVSPVQLRPNIRLISDHLTIAAAVDNATNTLRIQYFDDTNQTLSVQFKVYEDINQTPMFDNTYSNSSNITITINNVNASKRYGIHAIIHHTEFGNSPVNFVIGAGAYGILIDFGFSLTWIYQAMAFILILFTGLISTPKIRLPMTIFMAGIIAVTIYMGWFIAAGGAVVLLIVFVGLTVVYEIRKGGMT